LCFIKRFLKCEEAAAAISKMASKVALKNQHGCWFLRYPVAYRKSIDPSDREAWLQTSFSSKVSLDLR
jgi:hypothetical protein